MAPMLLIEESALLASPHTMKAAASTPVEPESEPVTALQCQVCFDDCTGDDKETAAVTKFCGAKCPAVLCRSCVAEHVRIAVSDAFAGVLPKVRCPICLVPVTKTKWESLASPAVLTSYAEACRKACSFQSPCCHQPTYSQLPYALGTKDTPLQHRLPEPLRLVPSLKKHFEPLRLHTRRFSNHKLSSKALINYIEDTFGRHVPIETQHLIVEHLLPRILDEERRATLLLSYHAKYKKVTTRCCGYEVCFNCKRLMSTHSNQENDAPCDETTLDADCIVECRQCHVTMVKVEGCSSVTCWCGFSMDWQAELHTRNLHKKKLLPVDPFDLDNYGYWESWKYNMSYHLRNNVFPTQEALRRSLIDQQLIHNTKTCSLLRTMLKHYVWRRRFSRSLPAMETELTVMRMKLLAKRLKKLPAFVGAALCWKWRICWKKVVRTVTEKQFWLAYINEHRAEQLELKMEEMAMLLPGL